MIYNIFIIVTLSSSFHNKYKVFPVVGILDDMISKTDTFVELTRM